MTRQGRGLNSGAAVALVAVYVSLAAGGAAQAVPPKGAEASGQSHVAIGMITGSPEQVRAAIAEAVTEQDLRQVDGLTFGVQAPTASYSVELERAIADQTAVAGPFYVVDSARFASR